MSKWLSQEDLVPERLLLPAVKKEVKGDIHNIKNADKIAQLMVIWNGPSEEPTHCQLVWLVPTNVIFCLK